MTQRYISSTGTVPRVLSRIGVPVRSYGHRELEAALDTITRMRRLGIEVESWEDSEGLFDVLVKHVREPVGYLPTNPVLSGTLSAAPFDVKVGFFDSITRHVRASAAGPGNPTWAKGRNGRGPLPPNHN